MNPKSAVLLALLCSAAPAAEFKFGAQTFTIPDGFTMERVAGRELIDRPIEMDFDEEGRLYVTDSSGSNEPVAEQLKKKPHRIVRLEDEDGDGIFDKRTVFADGMMFPEGAMWFDGSLYVSAPPVIWKLTDTDGDGVADRREEWFDGKTLTGCANDLHGPYLGLDGWIYWSKGAFAKQTYELANGRMFETRAAHIFRRRPEGGALEPVMTGGMDNPVGVVFTPEGERIFTTTFLQNPGGGQRDGLIHAIYGGVYGKLHDVIDGHKRTGDLMPVLAHLGPAAPCGLARYESAAFGTDYRNNLFACLFNLHKVTRHVLKPSGATYTTEDSDFVRSDNPDFHPTDVLEDADGSLLVIDTGGWYKICCPTSQLWKPDVLGAIYRIRRSDAPRPEDARGRKLDWKSPSSAELAKRLNDARPAVVRRATLQLRKRNDAAAALRKVENTAAVWALTGSVDPNAAEGIRARLASSDPSIQHAAIQAVSVTRDREALKSLIPLLRSPDAQVRRAAAEALGRLRDPSAVKPLLAAAGAMAHSDRVLEHSLIYALIEINSPDEARRGLAGGAGERRAALIALDQMDAGDLKAEEVTGLLDGGLKETATWIISHRKEWGAEVASHLEAELLKSAAERNGIANTLAHLSSAPAISTMLARVAGNHEAAVDARVLAFDSLKQARLKDVASADYLLASIRDSNPDLVRHAAEAAGSMTFKEPAASGIQQALQAASARLELPSAVRLEALNAMGSGLFLDESAFSLVLANLLPESPLPLRTTALGVISKAKLTDAQLTALGHQLHETGPLEISRLVDLYEKASSAAVGAALVNGLKDSRGLAGVHGDRLQQVLAKYPPSILAEAKSLLAQLSENAEKQAVFIDDLLGKVQGGDIRRGQAIFNSTRAACSSCHAIGYLGGNVGPDLTRIGQIRTQRDLLEAIVYPSASFVRSFEPFIVSTRDGDDFSGIIRKDGAEEIVLVTGPNAEVHVARADITEVRPGKVSVMPQGLNEQLTQGELADLLAFLKATR